MNDKPKTMIQDSSADDQNASDAPSETEYDLPVELFAGSVILIMGVLVLVTPLTTDMPADLPWNPLLINILSGGIYVLIGLFFLWRS